MKVCTKLSEIAARKRAVVVATYFPERKSKQGLFFEAVLFGKSNVLVRFKKTGTALSFVLEDHPRVKQFTIDFPTDYAPLTAFMEV